MSEVWQPVVGFMGYEVSNLGRVRSWRGRWGVRPEPIVLRHYIPPHRRRPGRQANGSKCVRLRSDMDWRQRRIARLVKEAFA